MIRTVAHGGWPTQQAIASLWTTKVPVDGVAPEKLIC